MMSDMQDTATATTAEPGALERLKGTPQAALASEIINYYATYSDPTNSEKPKVEIVDGQIQISVDYRVIAVLDGEADATPTFLFKYNPHEDGTAAEGRSAANAAEFLITGYEPTYNQHVVLGRELLDAIAKLDHFSDEIAVKQDHHETVLTYKYRSLVIIDFENRCNPAGENTKIYARFKEESPCLTDFGQDGIDEAIDYLINPSKPFTTVAAGIKRATDALVEAGFDRDEITQDTITIGLGTVKVPIDGKPETVFTIDEYGKIFTSKPEHIAGLPQKRSLLDTAKNIKRIVKGR